MTIPELIEVLKVSKDDLLEINYGFSKRGKLLDKALSQAISALRAMDEAGDEGKIIRIIDRFTHLIKTERDGGIDWESFGLFLRAVAKAIKKQIVGEV
jgi:hypothetical protein